MFPFNRIEQWFPPRGPWTTGGPRANTRWSTAHGRAKVKNKKINQLSYLKLEQNSTK